MLSNQALPLDTNRKACWGATAFEIGNTEDVAIKAISTCIGEYGRYLVTDKTLFELWKGSSGQRP
jgi:hypothetical protein